MIIFRTAIALTCVNALFLSGAMAQTVMAGQIIRSRSIISASSLVIQTQDTPGAFQKIEQVAGMEARAMLYPGRPIMASDIGPPTVIERNEIVTLIYKSGTLLISAEGRSLARGGIGDKIRVMNLSSRATISGIITRPGEIRIMP